MIVAVFADYVLRRLDHGVIHDNKILDDNLHVNVRHFIHLKGTGYDDEEAEGDDDILDAPAGMDATPGIEPALRDLQRASIKAGQELALQAFAISTARKQGSQTSDRVSRVHGELLLRTRILRRWCTRFVSIVDHRYFGAVLFLFCHDASREARQRNGTVALQNSRMIVLADTSVREIETNKKTGTTALFELRTSQRKYVFACENDERREFWLSNMTMCAE